MLALASKPDFLILDARARARNNYSVLHDQQIISNLVTVNIGNILLKHRDRLGSIELERLTMNRLIFKYLTFASMCYRASIPLATIFICRTAIEAGLREKLARARKRRMRWLIKRTLETYKEIDKLELSDLSYL